MLAQCSEQWGRRVQGAGCVSSDGGGLAGRPAVAGRQDQEERPRCAAAPAALTSCVAPIEQGSGKPCGASHSHPSCVAQAWCSLPVERTSSAPRNNPTGCCPSRSVGHRSGLCFQAAVAATKRVLLCTVCCRYSEAVQQAVNQCMGAKVFEHFLNIT